MEILDITIKLVPAFVALIVGALGVYIAYRQYKVNKDKLRLDLFEKRLEAYEKLQEYFNHFIAEGWVDNEAIRLLNLARYKSIFLFDNEVSDYIDKVQAVAIEMRKLQMKIHGSNALPDGEERNKACDRESEIFQWHLDQQKDSPKQYIKYLKFI
jgi:hypothetical protein